MSKKKTEQKARRNTFPKVYGIFIRITRFKCYSAASRPERMAILLPKPRRNASKVPLVIVAHD